MKALSEKKKGPERDERSAFGEYVGKKLKLFNARNSAILQNQISNLIFNMEMSDSAYPEFIQTSNHTTTFPTTVSNYGQPQYTGFVPMPPSTSPVISHLHSPSQSSSLYPTTSTSGSIPLHLTNKSHNVSELH